MNNHKSLLENWISVVGEIDSLLFSEGRLSFWGGGGYNGTIFAKQMVNLYTVHFRHKTLISIFAVTKMKEKRCTFQ